VSAEVLVEYGKQSFMLKLSDFSVPLFELVRLLLAHLLNLYLFYSEQVPTLFVAILEDL